MVFYRLSLKILSNNLLVTLHGKNNELLLSLTAGAVGFKGRQKRTQTASKALLIAAKKKLAKFKTRTNIQFMFKGGRLWRRKSLKLFARKWITITKIVEIPSFPHNGCKPVKKKRK